MKKVLEKILVWLGWVGFLVLSTLVVVFLRRRKTDGVKEKELREKDPSDIIDMLDNADAVRDIIRGRDTVDNPAAGDDTLLPPSVWGNRNPFHRARVDGAESSTVGKPDSDSGSGRERGRHTPTG